MSERDDITTEGQQTAEVTGNVHSELENIAAQVVCSPPWQR
jgi:hypothetical protein